MFTIWYRYTFSADAMYVNVANRNAAQVIYDALRAEPAFYMISTRP